MPEDSLVPSRSLLAEGHAALSPNSDLTYKIMGDISLAGIDVEQSLLTGTLMRNLAIKNSSFDRCDLEGTKVELCEFNSTTFTSADIRSSEFSKTQFFCCSFDDAFIKNCTFTDCSFVDCTFDASAFTESTLLRCDMKSVSLRGSSNMLNIFKECTFDNVILGDCTFLLHVCLDCSFYNVAFNLDSIGLLFGVDKSTIESNHFIFLGKEQEVATKDNVCEMLIMEYESRKWVLHAGVSKLNFHMISSLEFLSYLSKYIKLSIEHSIIVKQEDMAFLSNIFTALYESDRLPYFGLIKLLEEVGRISTSTQCLGSQNDASIHMLMNSAYLNIFRLEKKLTTLMPSIQPEMLSCQSHFTIAFKEKLSTDICSLLDTVARAINDKEANTKLISIYKGSIIYYVYSVVASVLGLQLLIWAMNGCVIQFTELIARVKALHNGPPKAYNDLAQSPEHPMPQEIQQTLKTFYSSMMESGLLTERLSRDLSQDNFVSISTPEADDKEKSKATQFPEESDEGAPE